MTSIAKMQAFAPETVNDTAHAPCGAGTGVIDPANPTLPSSPPVVGGPAASNDDWDSTKIVQVYGPLQPPEVRRGLVDGFKLEFIESNHTRRIVRKLDRMMNYAGTGNSEGISNGTFLLSGPTGSGKTRLLKRWAAKYARETVVNDEVKGALTIPVLWVGIPPRATMKALLEHCLRALKAVQGRGTSGSEGALESRVEYFLKERQVKVIIFDELQHLVAGNTRRDTMVTPDNFKTLASNVCPVILAGTYPQADNLFNGCEQLRRRAVARMSLGKLRWNDPVERAGFCAMLAMVAQKVPLKDASMLKDPRVALRLHMVSDGVFGRAFDYIAGATEEALDTGATKLTWEVFEELFEGFKEDRDDWFNVFARKDDSQLAGFVPFNPDERKTKLHRKETGVHPKRMQGQG
jgi:hypothetical protein